VEEQICAAHTHPAGHFLLCRLCLGVYSKSASESNRLYDVIIFVYILDHWWLHAGYAQESLDKKRNFENGALWA
jgi:hypothetical protein